MAHYNRNQLGPYSNSDQEWSEKLTRRGEYTYGEEEPHEDLNPNIKPAHPIIRNGPGNESTRNSRRGGYNGSPYDVGNYASHYDQKEYGQEDQPIRMGFGFVSEEQPSQRQKKDFRGKGPRSYQRSDKRILEDVNDRLYIDPYIDASDIDVKVDKGDVTLTGAVEDRDAKRRAEDIAEIVSGVKNVENRLRITKTEVVGPVRRNTR